ncbi:hypothetical protein [Brevibacillus panacihumi]|uniref:DUF3238 domain-containing protein n=1 Tax=Brevibacillus panacihumi TaxID=497735 RepID=A0A3M8CG71_9BACL|nr:hypothetical protein [Brevibacillus panacihumi]RNB74740.1 hypothetical protein EDM58_19710 [Brevibacillus panacihumi]
MIPFLKKKFIAILVATVTLTSLIPFTVSAASKDFKEIEEEVSFDMVKVGDLDVTVYEDGRVKGLGKSKSQRISKNERKKILKIMGFSEKEIDTLPEEMQEELLAEGGVKVDSEVEYEPTIYTDLDGVQHVVNEKNKEKIKKIAKKDFEKLQEMGLVNEDVTGDVTIAGTEIGDYEDGDFRGWGYIIYHGIEDSEYEYSYYTKFEWSSRPTLYFTDRVAHAWQYHTTSIRTSADYDVTYFSSSGRKLGSIDYDPDTEQDVYGSLAEIDIDYHEGIHDGYLKDKVRIPKSHKGETGTFVSRYVHSSAPKYVDGFSIGYGPISITIKGANWVYPWRNKFTIGKDY